jgi:hypothetical protein
MSIFNFLQAFYIDAGYVCYLVVDLKLVVNLKDTSLLTFYSHWLTFNTSTFTVQ